MGAWRSGSASALQYIAFCRRSGVQAPLPPYSFCLFVPSLSVEEILISMNRIVSIQVSFDFDTPLLYNRGDLEIVAAVEG